MKVLIVDDNEHMLGHLAAILEKEGLGTAQATSGAQALDIYKEYNPDFICLDILMHDMSGYDVCRKIRQDDDYTPIIFISSKSETVDKIVGLEIGADDYIVKPYDPHEVTARIRAIVRRCLNQDKNDTDDSAPFKMQDWEIFPRELVARRGDEKVELSLREINILRLFFNNVNKVVDRNMLLDYCWGSHIMPESRTLDWHISQLRKKIEKDPKNPVIIRTVHGAGYRFSET